MIIIVIAIFLYHLYIKLCGIVVKYGHQQYVHVVNDVRGDKRKQHFFCIIKYVFST
jgi:hypothetical protein